MLFTHHFVGFGRSVGLIFHAPHLHPLWRKKSTNKKWSKKTENTEDDLTTYSTRTLNWLKWWGGEGRRQQMRREEGREWRGYVGFWPKASFIIGSFSSSSLSSSTSGLKAYLLQRDRGGKLAALHRAEKNCSKINSPDTHHPTSGYWPTVAIGTLWPIGWWKTRSARTRHLSTAPSSPTDTHRERHL